MARTKGAIVKNNLSKEIKHFNKVYHARHIYLKQRKLKPFTKKDILRLKSFEESFINSDNPDAINYIKMSNLKINQQQVSAKIASFKTIKRISRNDK